MLNFSEAFLSHNRMNYIRVPNEMSTIFKYYKRRFKNALEPLLVMLVARKADLGSKKWNALVLRTVSGIVNNPSEYLGKELPEYSLTCDILYEIFEQFFKSKGDPNIEGFAAIANELTIAKRRYSQAKALTSEG
jgi:hypothetical protein